MDVTIRGHNLPGRWFRNAGVPIHDVHVGVQVRQLPVGLVPGDADTATWAVEVQVRSDPGGSLDFVGPAVHGRRGERFLYLTWGDGGSAQTFVMFRRAKLMLDAVDPALVRSAVDSGRELVATIDLTDDHGCPRCARVGVPALVWTVS